MVLSESRLISIGDLPPAPAGRSGWPWEDEVSDETPGPSDFLLPTISVITPSFNQGRYLEQTIRSVLLQRYPNLEYIVIDGGSTDESVEIMQKYARWISFKVSEKDRGQSHAINKGFAKAGGKIMCWLNSDDYYPPGTLLTAGRLLADGSGNFALAGHCLKVYQDGSSVLLEGRYEGHRRLFEFWKGYQMHQPAIFWRREAFEKSGGLDEKLHLIMDFDLWARISRHCDFVNVDRVLACCNYHDEAKTGDDYRRYHADLRKHATSYWGSILDPEFWRLWYSMTDHFTIQPGIKRLKSVLRKLLKGK